MSQDNRELQILLKNLDSVVESIRKVLLSAKSAAGKKQKTPFFLAKIDDAELDIILVKISSYKKLRQDSDKASNSEKEVASVMDIFVGTESLIQKISEGNNVAEYVENGFFKELTHISLEVKRLIA
ncbi:hypothetical protein [Legionella sainthelensi]|nr:hypothetical protein [Legionella sainthelensi]